MRADANALLLQSVAQTVDALSFTQSHVIDEDFRAHSRATIDSVRSLQREQRGRIDNAYGPRPLSCNALAAQLAATYRGEAAALEMAKENRNSNNVNNNNNNNNVDPTVVVTGHMTHSQCQAFKKEMKQRIHEWERAFRDEHGVAVTAHDKAALRHVYELYKAAKNRLRDTESPRNGSSEQPVTDRDASQEQQYHPQQQQQQGRRGGGEQQQQQQPQQPLHGMYNGSTGDRRGEATSGGLQLNSFSANQHETGGSAGFTAPATVTSSANGVRPSSTSSSQTRGAPVSQMSNEDLATEKRYLKRILHHFESEFEQQNGHAPTKNDRRAFTREYTRYGELKNEIQRRSENMNVRGSNGNVGTSTAAVENGEQPTGDVAATATTTSISATTTPGMTTTTTTTTSTNGIGL
ncbi:uncharacterized protein TM35_000421610 [Trypanosoma theileri]|uniref:FAM13A-like domain-containing protein n=1 Tax=Trypanosoma theileri TaxID=67003 RepID=A0A1X0NJS6_9TRYP|nr:uncharacterized protein TM35_000421610 [Trypanosoma theileri]ORC84703.1 hypothetical protein TM35_000421610 [Trypanosoma theileri]